MADIGFIGLGNMGRPMAERILAAGDDLTVWNRTRDRADDLAARGARVARDPAQILRECEFVALCCTDGKAVEEVTFGPSGLAEAGGAGAGKIVVDFSTIAPDDSRTFAMRLHAMTGAAWIDAPVSGGVPGAEKGTLVVFAGGEAETIARAEPLFARVAARVTHMGPQGAGGLTKICNQMIVAINCLTIAETFAFARRAGVDVERLAGALAGGFADSQPLQIFGPRMAARRYEPVQSAIALMRKDIGIARELAAAICSDTPVARFCSSLYETLARGEREGMSIQEDVSALVRLYDEDGSGRPAEVSSTDVENRR